MHLNDCPHGALSPCAQVVLRSLTRLRIDLRSVDEGGFEELHILVKLMHARSTTSFHVGPDGTVEELSARHFNVAATQVMPLLVKRATHPLAAHRQLCYPLSYVWRVSFWRRLSLRHCHFLQHPLSFRSPSLTGTSAMRPSCCTPRKGSDASSCSSTETCVQGCCELTSPSVTLHALS